MFPVLTDGQVARMMPFGVEKTFAAGDLLFDEGASGVPMHVILEGEVEIVHPRGPIEEPVTVHVPGEFTGEISLLADRRALVRARARTRVRVLELERTQLRKLVQTDGELSELLMRAFILRRMGLIETHQGDTLLIGSQHSAGTLRLKEFLTRNSHPYSYLDVELDPDTQTLLDRFHVGVKDVPITICRGKDVLRNPTLEALAACIGLNAVFDSAAVRDVR